MVDAHSQPVTKLHSLRMLNPLIFTKLPLASADSTNVARNIGIDKAWSGAYAPASKETRAALQRKALRESGVFFIPQRDGRPGTTWDHVSNPVGLKLIVSNPEEEEPNVKDM